MWGFLRGTGWWLLAIPDLPIGRRVENHGLVAETMKRIAGLLFQLLWIVMKKVIINAIRIVVRVCHC
jgi:hypothetical protein